jgi:transcriptional regulator with XRE-family HTH domain
VISLLEQFASSGAYDRMDEASIYFGKRVKYLRRLKNLTQAQLAEKLSLSVNYVSQIETGIASPSFKTLLLLSQGLDVELKDLFDFEQPISRKKNAQERDGKKKE